MPAVEIDGASSPTDDPTSPIDGASSPTEQTSPTRALGDGLPDSQLSLDGLAPSGTPGPPETGDTAGPDESDEPDESADLLVSVSAQALVGASEVADEGADAGRSADDAEVFDYGRQSERVAEWAYPAGVVPGEAAAGGTRGEGDASMSDRGAGPAPGAGPMAPRPVDDSEDTRRVDWPALQIRIARIRLRTGSLYTARAELEALAARDQLDTPAHLDLAEARWRTGDLQGAGEAAAAYLEDGGNAALGFVIAAEASAIANRPAEAAKYAEMALERCLVAELDPIFAGLPRKASWPADASKSSAGTIPAGPVAEAAMAEPEREAAPVAPAPIAGLSFAAPLRPAAQRPEASSVDEASAGAAQADPRDNAEVTAGRSFLAAEDPVMAALHFGVAIRLAPTVAGAVLSAIGERRDLPLQLVRGDALRLLGLEVDAGNTFLSVATALGAGKSTAQPEPASAEPAPPDPAVEPTPAPDPAVEPEGQPAAAAPPPHIDDELPPVRWE
jgi:hypothetical protein